MPILLVTFLVLSRIVVATPCFVLSLLLLLLLYPVFMLGVVSVYVIFRITGIADWLLIATTFKRDILFSMRSVVSIRPGLIHHHFVGIIQIMATITGRQR